MGGMKKFCCVRTESEENEPSIRANEGLKFDRKKVFRNKQKNVFCIFCLRLTILNIFKGRGNFFCRVLSFVSTAE